MTEIKKPRHAGVFLLANYKCLLALAWAIHFQTVTHVGMEVLKCLVFITLCLEWLGTYLLVTAAVTAVQGAHAVTLGRCTRPLIAVDRESCWMTQRRAQDIRTDFAARIVVMAISTGHVQLSALGIEVFLAAIIGRHGFRVVWHLDVEIVASRQVSQVATDIRDIACFQLVSFFAIVCQALVCLLYTTDAADDRT